MFHRFFALVLFYPLNECFVNFFAKAESKTTPNLPIDALSVVVGGRVEFRCVKPSSWTQDSASWVRMTAEDAKRCEKGLKKIKDDHHWFCDVLVSNRIVQSDFSERFSVGPLGSASENNLTLKNATLEDSGRYYCFNNRTKEIVKIYNLSVYCVTTAAAGCSSHITIDSRSSQSTTSEDIGLSGGPTELSGPTASVIIVAVCAVVVLVIIAVVVVIIIITRKRRNAIEDGSGGIEGVGLHRSAPAYSLYTDINEVGSQREATESHSRELRSDDGLIYLELKTAGNAIQSSRPQLQQQPIASVHFNCSIYAAIDHNNT